MIRELNGIDEIVNSGRRVWHYILSVLVVLRLLLVLQ